MFNKLRSGLEVYEDRHCGRADPGREQRRELPRADGRPPRRCPAPRPGPAAAATDEELQALVPDELLDRINKFAFANAPAGTVPAPACKKQAPYNYGGETTQYPHVKAGTGR